MLGCVRVVITASYQNSAQNCVYKILSELLCGWVSINLDVYCHNEQSAFASVFFEGNCKKVCTDV